MAIVPDLFTRGFPFDGATGTKTGAELEQLAEKLVPVTGSLLVDQDTIEDYEDATYTDAGGVNPIRRFRVADGSVTRAKLAGDFYSGLPLLSQDNGDFFFTSTFPVSRPSSGELDSITTALNTSETGAYPVADTESMYTRFDDSSNVYQGKMVIKMRLVVAAGGYASVAPWYAFETPTFSSGFPTNAFFTAGNATASGFYVPGPADEEIWIVSDFWGVVGGITFFLNSTTANYKITRWACLGAQATNI